ncbi:MAG: FKBP-type peptidyl-prolyl cis-trans isomerase N-terminal domain-containing protein [Gammaproteobacteria bacterium]|nr:FKBP-type peptidyl-prolyl cis-trans isomerase N-terminal domain-containing protein [Gammaproteobacteria bacterium]
MGYFFGYSFGNMLKQGGNNDVNLETLMQGIRDSLEDKAPDLTEAQQQEIISTIQANQQRIKAQAQAAQEEAATENLATGENFLAENAERKGSRRPNRDFNTTIPQPGYGESPTADSQVRVHYEGRLITDSLRQLLRAWRAGRNWPGAGHSRVDRGLQLMSEAGKARLFLPSELAGWSGGTRGIPPNSVLIFEVELLEVL